MAWWKKALIATVFLMVLDAAFAVAVHRHNQHISTSAEVLEARDDRLGRACGQILGFGTAIIWAVAVLRRKQ
jgi:hypothetical protein